MWLKESELVQSGKASAVEHLCYVSYTCLLLSFSSRAPTDRQNDASSSLSRVALMKSVFALLSFSPCEQNWREAQFTVLKREFFCRTVTVHRHRRSCWHWLCRAVAHSCDLSSTVHYCCCTIHKLPVCLAVWQSASSSPTEKEPLLKHCLLFDIESSGCL